MAKDMLREMRASDCVLEQARLGLVHLRAMFGDVSLVLREGERLARKLLSGVLDAYGVKPGHVVDHSVHDESLRSARAREAEWTQYADTMDERLADAARIVEASSAAWTEEQRRFRELINAARAVRATIERQAGSLSNVSDSLRGVGEAAPRPTLLQHLSPRVERRVMTSSHAATLSALPEV